MWWSTWESLGSQVEGLINGRWVSLSVSVQEANLRVLLLDVSRDDAQADIGHLPELQRAWGADRKSTRLNSSH